MKIKRKFFYPFVSLILTITLFVSVFMINSFANESQVNISIDTNDVIQDDYLGVGGNFVAQCMSEEGIEKLGMSQAYLDLNIKRINTVQPSFMRIFFMPHHMVDFSDGKNGEENWKNGKYDFENSYAKSFFAYCDAFKNAGTEILLNFGWGVSEEVQEWYAIESAPDTASGSRSAPDDLEAFAKAASALLQECFKRGYDNITYLNFYNEVCHVEYGAFGDRRLYWCNMIKAVHEQLVKDGIRDKVKIVGADCDTQYKYKMERAHYQWLDYVKENASDYYDTLSVHTYWAWDYSSNRQLRTVDDMYEYSKDILKDHSDVLVTEFSFGTNNGYDYSRSGTVIAQSNAGISGSAFWSSIGTYIPKPFCNMQDGPHNLWAAPSKYGVDTVYTTFGEMGLLMRYVPQHSKVVKSESNSDDVRVATYEKDDDITIVVEANKSNSNRNLSINLGKNINKNLEKHVYIYPDDINDLSQYDANAVLPVSSGDFKVSDSKFTDEIGKEHCMIVYTTIPEESQICLDAVEKTTNVGGTVNFSVTKTYGADVGSFKWEVLTGNGTVDGNGNYTASGTTTGDTVSIKVSSIKNEDIYAIAIVKIA